jgi:uncharacterized protein (TIRG00374 family)
MMKKNAVRLGLILLISLVFLFFFLRSVDWGAVFRYLVGVDVFFFALIVLLVPMHLVTRATRWYFLLRREKKGIRFFHMFAGNAIGFTVTNIFPGRLGEIIKPLYLAKKEGMRKGFVMGTIVIERIFDIFAMCFILGIFLLARPLYASIFRINPEASSSLFFWGKTGVVLATVLLILCLSLYFFKQRTLRVVSFFLKPIPAEWTRRILSLANEFIEGLKFFHSAWDVVLYAVMSLAVWLGIIFYYWLLFFTFHIQVPFFVLVPYVFLTMVGASIPTPGMVGGFDYFSKLGMTSLYQLDANLAVGMTIVIHTVQIIVTCLIGYAILWKEGLSLFQLKKMGETESS